MQRVRVGGDVHAGQVGQRQTHALGQVDQLALVDQEQEGALEVVGPVQADRQRAVGVGPGGALVQVVAAPGVVGLPGGDRVLDHDLARRAGRAHGQRHVALGARVGVQPEQVGAVRPACGRHRQRRAPVGVHGAGRLVQPGRALPAAAHRAGLPDLAGQVTAVPAHPEGPDPELARGGRDVQADRLAGQHAGLAGVAEDGVRGAQRADPPAGVAGPRVLRHRFMHGVVRRTAVPLRLVQAGVGGRRRPAAAGHGGGHAGCGGGHRGAAEEGAAGVTTSWPAHGCQHDSWPSCKQLVAGQLPAITSRRSGQ